MDIEQLKLILATLHDAGTGAFVIAIIWLAKSFLLWAIGLTLVAIAFVKIGKGIAWAIATCEQEVTKRTVTEKDAEGFIAYINGRLGVNYFGRYSAYFITSDDRERIKRVVELGIEAYKKEKPNG